jgi:hypothetical protein
MNQELILYPALLMALLSFAVGIFLYRQRFIAVKRDDVRPVYFLHNRGGKLPDYLVRAEQNYSNQFELPVLFYAVVFMLYLTHSADLLQLILLWGFALSRVAHTLVHVTVNRLLWRRNVFSLGFLLLLASWCYLLIQLMQRG